MHYPKSMLACGAKPVPETNGNLPNQVALVSCLGFWRIGIVIMLFLILQFAPFNVAQARGLRQIPDNRAQQLEFELVNNDPENIGSQVYDNTKCILDTHTDPEECKPQYKYLLTQVTVKGFIHDGRDRTWPMICETTSDTCPSKVLTSGYWWTGAKGPMTIQFTATACTGWTAFTPLPQCDFDESITIEGSRTFIIEQGWLPGGTCKVTYDVGNKVFDISDCEASTESPAPTPTPTLGIAPESPQADRDALIATVTGNNLNVREGAGTTYRSFMKLATGTKVSVLGRNEQCTWLHIASGDTHGWVAFQYVSVPVACSAIPLDPGLPTIAPASNTLSGPAATGNSTSAGPGLITGFESWGSWLRGDEPYGTFAQSGEQKYSGQASGKFTFDLPANRQNFVVYRQSIAIPGQPDGLKMWVYGDASGVFLNVWLQDAQGQRWQFGFGRVSHVGWKQMTAPFNLNGVWPNGPVGDNQVSTTLTYPLSLFAIIVDGEDNYDNVGTFYLDDLTAAVGVGATGPAANPPTAASTAIPTPIPLANPNLPAMISFRADRTSIAANECTTLRWDVDNVREVYFGEEGTAGYGVVGHDSKQVCVTSNKTFFLRILQHDGIQQINTVTISVSSTAVESPQYSIWADRTEINAGECVNIFWHAEHVREVYFGIYGYDVEAVTGDDSRNVCLNQTTRYMLRVVLTNGSEDYPYVDVNVRGAPPVGQPTDEPTDGGTQTGEAQLWIYADPSSVQAGGCATIRWTSENVAKVEFGERGKGLEQVELNGSRPVCPNSSTEYVVMGTRASGSQGEVSIWVYVEGNQIAPQPEPTAAPTGPSTERCGTYVLGSSGGSNSSFLGQNTGTLGFAVRLFAPDGGGYMAWSGPGGSIDTGQHFCLGDPTITTIEPFTTKEGYYVDMEIESTWPPRAD